MLRRKFYRIYIAKYDISDPVTSLIASVPGVHYSLGFVNPWHRNRCAALNNDRGIGIGLENSRDEFIGIGRQVHRFAILSF